MPSFKDTLLEQDIPFGDNQVAKAGTPIHNALVKIMVKLMNRDITNERFIINAEHMSYKKLMCTVAKSLHHSPPIIKTPNWLMKLFIYLHSQE